MDEKHKIKLREVEEERKERNRDEEAISQTEN